jgi:hypothetical protein
MARVCGRRAVQWQAGGPRAREGGICTGGQPAQGAVFARDALFPFGTYRVVRLAADVDMLHLRQFFEHAQSTNSFRKGVLYFLCGLETLFWY